MATRAGVPSLGASLALHVLWHTTEGRMVHWRFRLASVALASAAVAALLGKAAHFGFFW